MLTLDDAILLLATIPSSENYIERLLENNSVTQDVLKFINDSRELQLISFYQKIRKSYNGGHSKLYINLMKGESVLTTLSAYQTQCFLFLETCDDKAEFIRSSRLIEVSKSLIRYMTEFDIEPALLVLRAIKSDIKLFEEIQ